MTGFGKILILPVLFIAGTLPLPAQNPSHDSTFNIASSGIRFPHGIEASRLKLSAGFSMVRPPKDMLETAIQAPLVNFHATYSLPWHLSVEGDLTTILVSNQLSMGPGISFSSGNFGFRAGYNIAYVAGFLNQFGFDNSTRAWINYPNISLGCELNKIAFTFRGESVIVSSISTSSGDNELTRSRNFFNGFTGALYIEQRLHRNRVFVIGFKNSYVKYYWPTWMAFSTFNRFYNIPELYFSWIL
jgi:hypothetical protein